MLFYTFAYLEANVSHVWVPWVLGKVMLEFGVFGGGRSSLY